VVVSTFFADSVLFSLPSLETSVFFEVVVVVSFAGAVCATVAPAKASSMDAAISNFFIITSLVEKTYSMVISISILPETLVFDLLTWF
jgi:hypothetical protein